MKRPAAPNAKTVELKPTATATLEPLTGRSTHGLRLVLRFGGQEPFVDRAWVLGVAERAMALLEGEATFGDALGKVATSPVGVEGFVTLTARPELPAIDRMREVLSSAGYGVRVHEVRACGQPSCAHTALVDGTRPDAVPRGWFGAKVCGKHGYKTCPACSSTYVMSSANATGAAPSVHCEVCGGILVEWGGTKVWTAELISRAGA